LLEFLKTTAPIAIAIVALAITVFFNILSHRDRISAAEDRKQTAKLAREKDIQLWAKDIADVYVKIRIENERNSALIRLSVLIDYGRLFFPNDNSIVVPDRYNKGLRSSILDPLVETFARCKRGDWNDAKITQDWREFTDQLASKTTAFATFTAPESVGRIQYRNT
jgi:hypothetical protein